MTAVPAPRSLPGAVGFDSAADDTGDGQSMDEQRRQACEPAVPCAGTADQVGDSEGAVTAVTALTPSHVRSNLIPVKTTSRVYSVQMDDRSARRFIVAGGITPGPRNSTVPTGPRWFCRGRTVLHPPGRRAHAFSQGSPSPPHAHPRR